MKNEREKLVIEWLTQKARMTGTKYVNSYTTSLSSSQEHHRRRDASIKRFPSQLHPLNS